MGHYLSEMLNPEPVYTGKGDKMIEKKLFMWYDSGRIAPMCGPHYTCDVNAIGSKLYHSLDDLLKTSMSDALKKRLKSAKIGTQIKIHYLHSNGNLMVKRITEKEAKALDELQLLYNEINGLNTNIMKLTSRCDEIRNRIKIKSRYE